MSEQCHHVSVLLNEVITMLDPQDGCIYFDGTFGGGGYTRAILEAANCEVIACDRDPFVQNIAAKFKEKYLNRFSFVHAKFSNIKAILNVQNSNYEKVDGVILDLGVSNFQLSDPERGFSFKLNGPLDMSMGLCEENALELLQKYSEEELADIIYVYGEEHFSRRIAKAICNNKADIKTTADLANLIRKCVPKTGKMDPATKTFQAFRIFVNDELGELKQVLQDAVDVLKPNGKIIAVSFHSLEDRIIKYFFRGLIEQNAKNKTQNSDRVGSQFILLNKKPIIPSEREISMNPKSRSAKLRGICML